MYENITIVIPAYNVENTILDIVHEFEDIVDEIIVINNNSTDETEKNAKKSTATVLNCSKQGMGFAIKKGVSNSKNEFIIKIDGDIKNPKKKWVELLYDEIKNNDFLFVNSIYKSNYDEFPVGTLTARPAIKVLYPELKYVKIPLSGTYIFRKSKLDWRKLNGDWSFDIGLLIDAYKKGSTIGQVEIGFLNDFQKKISEYHEMAFEILRFLIESKYKNV